MEKWGSFQFLVQNLKGRDHLGVQYIRWEDSTKTDLKEIACELMDWIQLSKDSVP
jgi:hypothetical protein